METVIIVVHLMVVIAMCGAVLLQRSEGGALGMGGGGGGAGGFMTGRGAANVLTRVTAVLAAGFFVTSIALTLLARQSSAPTSILDGTSQTQGGPAQSTPQSILDQLPARQNQQTQPPVPAAPQVPQSQ